MSSIADINAAIIGGTFTDEQLTSIQHAIKFARAQIINKNTSTLVIGTKVKFTGRQGRIVLGTVEKVNRKFIIVSEQNSGSPFTSKWRVPANMLTKV